MNAELAHKQPATVLSRRPAPRGQVRQVVDLAAPSRKELLAALGRRQRAGEIESTAGEIRLLTEGPKVGHYAVRVVLVPPREPAPRWALVCLSVGRVLLGLAALLAAAAWLLSALSVASLVAAVVTVLGMFGLFVWAKYGRRNSRGVTVGVRVDVR